MTIKSIFSKKITALVLALTLTIGFGTVVYATTYGNLKNGASTEEVLQVKYNGAAWNYSNSGYDWASFKYTSTTQNK